MGLDALIDAAASRGRKPINMTASVARTLTPEDLMELAQGGNGVPTPKVQELRASHHKLAQTLAKGASNIEASEITGYSLGRIIQLKADPQFEELLSHYSTLDSAEFIDQETIIRRRLADLSIDTLEVAHERLLDNPDSFSAKDLALLAELGLDRIGHGKQTKQEHEVTHKIDEDQLRRIREGRDAPAEVSPEDRQALVGLALFATELHPESQETQGESGSGDSVREEGRQGTSEAARTVINISPVD